MKYRKYNSSSKVEEAALRKSCQKLIYPPAEKVPSITVDSFPSLGKLTALRFLEWAQLNPVGVVSLPTGKTPEYFIKWTSYYLKGWNRKEIKKELEEWGISPDKPDLKSLFFVQIDEFYPISPQHQNSFYYYLNKFYFKEMGLNKKHALLINAWNLGIPSGKEPEKIFPEWKVDLSLRFRRPTSPLEKLQQKAIFSVDQFCLKYEEKIKEMGGIGFFLGGIGPDGHIGFNISGSDHNSTTRLTSINYETAAAAATDLGGIEVSRNRAVITIGLGTITYNPSSTTIIMAAGNAKAKIIRDTIQNEPSILYPGTVLQRLNASRFYLTKGSASLLQERKYEDLLNKQKVSLEDIEDSLINLSLKEKKKILEITEKDVNNDRFTHLILKKSKKSSQELTRLVNKRLIEKIEKGRQELEGKTFLHTAPHHDDIMLGYISYVLHLVRSPKNKHYFIYLTSGFTSVTNYYVLRLLKKLEHFLNSREFTKLSSEGYFEPNNLVAKNRDVYHYLDAVANDDNWMKEEANSRRLLRILVELYEDEDPENLRYRIEELENYLRTQYPGKKDITLVQRLKGMIREWEAELLWGYLGFNCSNIVHLRLGFYTGNIFNPPPEKERDIQPLFRLLKKIKPDILTVALDPEGTGPDTHYKALQATSEALVLYKKENPKSKIKVWGYRNIWHHFSPSEANIFVPVSMNSFAILNNTFLNCFGSQKQASFPSYEYDGPFSDLARQIIVNQYKIIKRCLGRDFFYNNPIPRLRASRGLTFIKELTVEELCSTAQQLRERVG